MNTSVATTPSCSVTYRPSLTIEMLSQAESIAGQGVGSAYREEMNLLEARLPHLKIKQNIFSHAHLLHVHTINPTYFIRLKTSQVPTLGSVHFLPETLDESIRLPRFARKIFYVYLMKFYRSCDHLVTVNPSFAEKLVALGFEESRVHYIPNYVSDSTFKPLSCAERIAAKKRFGIPQDAFVVLGVGQVQKRKGVIDFCEVAKKMPDTHFIWAGGFSFGPLTDGYDELQKLTHNPPENITFLGIVDRSVMPQLYGLSDVMFLPSFSELFPMTILEAASTLTPILVRKLDLYEPILGKNYPSASSVLEFAEKIAELQNSREALEVATAFSQSIKERYSAETIAKMWNDLYTKIALSS